jgi:hypothetical protein
MNTYTVELIAVAAIKVQANTGDEAETIAKNLVDPEDFQVVDTNINIIKGI